MPKQSIPCVVSIAGTDPSGGAGIQADIKTISATGCYAASIITFLVAQNTRGVRSIYSISTDFIKEQINAVFEDLTIDAVKIGMVYNKDIIEIIASALKKYKPEHIVLDPVMVAKDGSLLIELDDLAFMKNRLFPLSTLITPNLIEAERIYCQKIDSPENMCFAAENFAHQFKTNILIKGGHFKNEQSSDVLFLYQSNSAKWLHSKRNSYSKYTRYWLYIILCHCFLSCTGQINNRIRRSWKKISYSSD